LRFSQNDFAAKEAEEVSEAKENVAVISDERKVNLRLGNSYWWIEMSCEHPIRNVKRNLIFHDFVELNPIRKLQAENFLCGICYEPAVLRPFTKEEIKAMGHGYEFRCLTHGKNSESINRGERILNDIWNNRHAIKKTEEVLPAGIMPGYPYADVLEFLFEHFDCRMATIDEYGNNLKPLENGSDK
jgi:hypothetical protein